MSNWKKARLSDVIEIIGGGTPKRSENSYWNGDINWLSVADFNNDFRFVSSSAETITELGLQKSSTKLLQTGQLIISARGTVGCLAQLSKPMAFNQSCYGLNGKDGIDNSFLYYFLKNNITELKQKTHGAVFDTITRDTFEHIEIHYPELNEQKKIADILGTLDDKIQLNTQINQTLEQMATAIFKSWFIDFDPVRAKADAIAQGADEQTANIAAMSAISGKTVEELTALPSENYTELYTLADNFPSELEMVDGVEVPKGWGVDKLNNLFDVGIGKTPPRKEEQWFTENSDDVEWISIKDMGNQGVFVTHSSEYLTEEAVSQFNIRIIPENTVILSFKLTLGRVAITSKRTTTNEAIAHFKVNKSSKLSTEYLYLWFKQYDFDSLGSTSSIATAVNSKTIKDIAILVPNAELVGLFNQKIDAIFKTIRLYTEENQSLAHTRDLLLPKLLSGEIEL